MWFKSRSFLLLGPGFNPLSCFFPVSVDSVTPLPSFPDGLRASLCLELQLLLITRGKLSAWEALRLALFKVILPLAGQVLKSHLWGPLLAP